MAMTPADELRAALNDIIKRLTYKPGWTFYVVPEPINRRSHEWKDEFTVTLVVQYKTLDVETGKLTDITQTKSIYVPTPGGKYEAHSFAWDAILSIIRYTEKHEHDEWLKFDGMHVNDPHPERKVSQ